MVSAYLNRLRRGDFSPCQADSALKNVATLHGWRLCSSLNVIARVNQVLKPQIKKAFCSENRRFMPSMGNVPKINYTNTFKQWSALFPLFVIMRFREVFHDLPTTYETCFYLHAFILNPAFSSHFLRMITKATSAAVSEVTHIWVLPSFRLR